MRGFDSFGLKVVVGVLGVLYLASGARAQWVVVNLHPAGTGDSFGNCVHGRQQVGQARVGMRLHSSLWTGSANSWIDLNPTRAIASYGYGVRDGQQVGAAYLDGTYHAGIWTGTADSWVDLHPNGVGYSWAFAIGDGQQVGITAAGSHDHASLWSGSSASWVDLNPAGAISSGAYGVNGGVQVGISRVGGIDRASMWTGTAASWVDLAPAGATQSQALAVDGGHQVGTALLGGVFHASMWSGTAASWVDLAPAGATMSRVYGVYRGQQVGNATVGGVSRASFWRGTAASWVDLHAFMPLSYSDSVGSSIWQDATDVIYVVGYAHNDMLGRYEALMWVLPANVPPTSFTVFRGVLESGDLASLLNSDDNYLVARNGVTALRTESPIMLRVSGQSPLQTPVTFQFVVENKVSITGLNQLIDLYDYAQGRFVNADIRAASTSDTTVTVNGSSANLESGTRNVQSQIQIRPAGPVFTNTWRSFVDQTKWLIG